jgi:hypothetical protein
MTYETAIFFWKYFYFNLIIILVEEESSFISHGSNSNVVRQKPVLHCIWK